MARGIRNIDLEFYGRRNSMAFVNRIRIGNSGKECGDSSFKRREHS